MQQKSANPDAELPSILFAWAKVAASNDVVRARQILLVGKAAANRNRPGSAVRLEYLHEMIWFYSRYGPASEKARHISYLDEQLRILEKAPKLGEKDRESVANALLLMAEEQCHKPGDGYALRVKDYPEAEQSIISKRCKAELYQKRAIAQFDKLPPYLRINAHIQLKNWYQSWGMTKEMNEQIRTLDLISGSVNWRELEFPKVGCNGFCGLG